jgi:anaerobic magnesium-protoporphyrin IX monomethyl ester cyclase
MRVLLVNSPPYQVREPFYDKPPYPRTALACLAGHLRRSDVDVGVLDCKFDRLEYHQAMDRIRDYSPDLVGFTAFTNEIIQAGRLAMMVKQWRPSALTVIGGVHVSALPERTMREFPQFDYAVLNEGEQSLLELVRSFETGADPLTVPGVAGLDSQGQCVFAGTRKRIEPLDLVMPPAWDLFRPASEYFLQTSRGCPFHCPFCMNPNGRKVRPVSVGRVLDEIESLAAAGATTLHFGDEIFTVNRERTVALCQGMIDRGINRMVRWWCCTHVRFVDREIAEIMKAAGCYEVGLGIESGDPLRLQEINKGTTQEDIIKAVQAMKAARLPCNSFFILGYPNETKESAMETINFAVRLNASMPVIGIMVPYPGTKFGQMAERGEGGYTIIASDWNDYNKQLGNALSFEYVSRKTLERIQLWGYIKVYLWNWRLVDLMKFIWQYRIEGLSVLRKQMDRLFRMSNPVVKSAQKEI